MTLPKRLPGQTGDAYLEVLVRELERALAARRPGARFDVAGPERRTLNSATASASQTAEVLATLVRDLKQAGVLG